MSMHKKVERAERNDEQEVQIEQNQHYGKEYYIVKEAVTNELAKKWIVESIDVEGEIELPIGWIKLAEMKHKDILSMMKHQKQMEDQR